MNMYALLSVLGISREQFSALGPLERQMALAKYMSIVQQQQQNQLERMQAAQQQQQQHHSQQQHHHQQQQQQQHHQQQLLDRQALAMGMPPGNMGSMSSGGMSNMNMGGPMSPMNLSHMSNLGSGGPAGSGGGGGVGGAFDRPSSSASSHSVSQNQNPSSNQNQMMPPPPPRPPTAQGGLSQLHHQQLAQAQQHQHQQQQHQQAQAQAQGQHISRPGTSMSHRSPTIPGSQSGSMQEMMLGQGSGQRPQSRLGQRDSNMMNGFKPPSSSQGGAQQSSQSGGGQQSMFTNASQSSGGQNAQQARPQSSQGGGQQQHQQQHHHHSNQAQQQQQHISLSSSNTGNANVGNNATNNPGTSASPPAGMNSPYHGMKRKLPGGDSNMPSGMNMNMPSSNMSNMSGMNMNMSSMNNMSNMGGGMNPMNMNAMGGGAGGGGAGTGGPGMSNMSLGNLQSLNALGGMPSLTQMGAIGGPGSGSSGGPGVGSASGGPGVSNIGGGIPGSPRIGAGGMGGGMGSGMGPMGGAGMGSGMSGMSSGMGGMSAGGMGGMGGGGMSGTMGPPGLPRSISNDALNTGGMGAMGGMSGMNAGGGMGTSMGSLMSSIGGMPSNLNMGSMGGMGNMGGMSGGMGGGMGNMGMSGGMPNMSGMGGAGNMGNMGGVGGMGVGNMGVGNIGGGNMGVGGMGGVSNMGMSSNMMNGPRGSPRPQSSMEMAGIGGGAGPMNIGVGGGASTGGVPGMHGPMNIDIPSRTASVAGGLPHTPLRQGSHPPQAAPTPPHGAQAQMAAAAAMHHTPGGSGGMGPGAPGTPMRQGSMPPTGPMGRGGMGMGGGMRAPASPHPAASGMGSGVGGGAQAMAMTPSLSASSLGSMGGPQITASSLGGTGGPSLPPASSVVPPAASTSVNTSATPGAAITANGLASAPSTNGTTQPPAVPAVSGANYNPKTTEVTLVPLSTSLTTIPALSASEISEIQEWMATDRAYDARLREMQGRMLEEARETFSVGGAAGLQWWERGAPGNGVGNWNRWRRQREQFDVRYPRTRREGQGRRKGARREGLKLPRKIAQEDADKPETLVPIRIEFDVEHHKMRDTFVWNLNDPVVTPEIFAQSIVEDYSLAPSYHSIIVKSIQDQLGDFRMHSNNYDGDGAELHDVDDHASIIKGHLDDEEAKWWAVWRRRVKLQSARAFTDDEESTRRSRSRSRHGSRKRQKTIKKEYDDDVDADVSMLADNEADDEDDEENEKSTKDKNVTFDDDEFSPFSLEDIKLDDKAMHEDMRILIKLDIIVGSIKLDDQFEWDLDNLMASPEDFAEVYTQELGLGGEFKTAISHSIREQVQTYQKSLFLVGHPSDGTTVQDDDLKQSFLPSLTSGARPSSEVGLFTPLLNYLSDGELERTEKERDKDLNKRRKRNTRGRRGVALPDREPIRTYRTPAIGFPELDAATLAAAAIASAPMSRRAAAAAASVTIANMVASENGIAFTPQMMPSAPQPPPQATASKDKKPKGLFKPPSYSSSVLRPRAHVVAPTPSTAADVSSMPSAPGDGEGAPSSSSGVQNAQDSRNNKAPSAKRVKELEREAKEKEFVDGQHPNYIDGVWHCSNCGCPESIAIGRRKGPLGDKSQCGTCGKFWHRHRRPRPVEYNSDPDFHSGIKQKEHDASKAAASKKRGAASALRATLAADASEPQTPTRSNGDLDRRSASPHDDDRGVSPISTASSASEAPLAQRVKLNGSNHPKSTPTPAPVAPVTPAKPPPPEPVVSPQPAPAPPAAPPSPAKTWPPQWLSAAMQSMQQRYPNDKFEVILRKVNASSTPEWRIKCLDCPGKLYTPGPGETLSNYDVHLKNRQHRQRVNDRLAAAAAEASSSDAAKS
ncbi:SNF5-domain-containing protein [Pholiota conissans]|uniref:SNF5-domain-containing protein n=1 Tax=Pholiota conissans TaxID=109636 RepID=A0A9P5YT34_9AGAR|nr:SNF5-domain-containing protein [Pholiota conissans]